MYKKSKRAIELFKECSEDEHTEYSDCKYAKFIDSFNKEFVQNAEK